MFLAALATLSFMEPGGKKGIYWDFQPLPSVATCWLPKAGRGPRSPHWLSQPLTSAPSQVPMEVEDQETSCFGALAQAWARARR